MHAHFIEVREEHKRKGWEISIFGRCVHRVSPFGPLSRLQREFKDFSKCLAFYPRQDIKHATPNFEITPCNSEYCTCSLHYNYHEIKNFFPARYVTHVEFISGEHELQVLVLNLRDHINHTGEILIRQLRRKDYLATKCEKLCAIITAHLLAVSAKRGEYIFRIFTILLLFFRTSSMTYAYICISLFLRLVLSQVIVSFHDLLS